jgi:AraC-like DNA-binding protein
MTTDLLPTINVRWLTAPDADVKGNAVQALGSAVAASRRESFPFPAELGHGWFQRLLLAQNMTLFHGTHRFKPKAFGHLIALGDFQLEFPVPTLVVQSVQGGTIMHRERYPQAELIYRPGYDFFRHAERAHVTPMVDASSCSEMTSLTIADSTLVDLIGEALAQQLLARLGLDAPPVVRVLPMPVQVSAPLRAAISTQLQGPLQILFAQAKVLEYLCALASHVVSTDPQEPRLTRKRDRVHGLHDYLLQQGGKLPKLDALAQQFGMSARRLNESFAKEFGMPIVAFITERRLHEAQQAIRDSDVPLKTLAMRLGYAHVNHFNRAFKRQFGVAPGSLRKGVMTDLK